jgi:hypothetical protein
MSAAALYNDRVTSYARAVVAGQVVGAGARLPGWTATVPASADPF